MTESKRMVSVKISRENLYVFQPNATTYHLVKLVKSFSQSFQWRSTVYKLKNGTLIR